MDMPARILVVDDEEKNRRLLEALLVPLGYEVIAANNGEQALERVRNDKPDVVLLDVMMPVLDGFETVRRLKEDDQTRTIPVVMVTALSGIEDRVKALEVGADDFLSKPIDKYELQARVRSLVKVKAYNDHQIRYQEELETKVNERTKQLQKAFIELQAASLTTIHHLSRAAEYKDEDTGAHIHRMSHYAAAVSRQMGLGDKVTESILYAAPMHDVGKIGVPDSILLKPSKLNIEEWELMKQHCNIGASILHGPEKGFLKLAQIIALTHHEKWNGTGYPNGLKGSEIPLAGQIAAIADVFDALTSKRPYKEPFPIDETYSIIMESRGNHFNPELVDAFFATADKILNIKEQYQDYS